MKIKSAGTNPTTPVYYVVNQILYPLVQGCESKDVKIIKVRMKNRLLFYDFFAYFATKYYILCFNYCSTH